MIILNSVSKEVGRGLLKKLVIDDVSWTIPPRTRIVILGQRGSGKSTLLQLMAGLAIPTKGWIERRAVVSVPGGVFRFASHESTRQLIRRLSPIYSADPKEVALFARDAVQRVAPAIDVNQMMDVKIRRLPASLRVQLNMAVTYGFPCDYYLFDSSIHAGRNVEFRDFCRQAFDLRSRQASTIVVTGSSRTARTLGEGAMGGVLFAGKLTLFESIDDATAVFESLPPEEAAPDAYQPFIEQEAEQDGEEEF